MHLSRLALGVAAAVALVDAGAPATASPHAAGPRTPTPAAVTATGCEEHEAWVDGDVAAVARVLPAGYTPVTDTNGAPIVFARAERCEAVRSGGYARPSTIADWGVVVQSPDGHGCSSGVPIAGAVKGDAPPACNWFTLGLVSDDRRIVTWLRQGTPAVPARYVRRLVYQLQAPDAAGRSTFHFAAPGPTPFTIDDVSSFRPGQISLRGTYWFRVPQGTLKMLVSTDDLTGGPADTTLSAPRGSALAALLGATTRRSVEPYRQFGVIRAAHGVERKQLVGPALPHERLTSFSGSCDLQGDVTFKPPATDTQSPTVYTYDSEGTCTGTLNGHALAAAPVHLHQSGRADASCVRAMSFPPGTGVINFPGGARLPYTLDFTSTTTELYGAAYGTRSGQATGHGTFLTQRSSPTLTTSCASTGLAKAPMDMSFRTDNKLVSTSLSREPAR